MSDDPNNDLRIPNENKQWKMLNDAIAESERLTDKNGELNAKAINMSESAAVVNTVII